MFAAMDTDVTRATAKALAMLRHRLGDIDAAYLAQIIQLARDEAIVEAVREAAYKAGEVALEAAQYLEKKADAIEAVANGGWNAAEMLSVAMATGGTSAAELLRESLEDGSDTGVTAALAALSKSTGAGPTGSPVAALTGKPLDDDSVFAGVKVSIKVNGIDEFPRLKELLESGEIDEADYQELIKFFRLNPDFTPEEFFEFFYNACLDADAGAMKVLTAAMYDRLEKINMSDEEGEGPEGAMKFWNKFVKQMDRYNARGSELGSQPALAVMMAAGGLPDVPEIVQLAFRQFGAPYESGNWNVTYSVLEALGAPPPHDSKYGTSSVQEWMARQEWWDELVAKNVRETGSTRAGRDLILASFHAEGGGTPMWSASATNSALYDLAESHADFREGILDKTTYSGFSQRFADQLSISNDFSDDGHSRENARKLTDEFFALLVDTAATGMDPDDPNAFLRMAGLAQLQRAMFQTGRDRRPVDPEAMLDLFLAALPSDLRPSDIAKAKSFFQDSMDLIGSDGLMDSRTEEDEYQLRAANLAFLVETQEAATVGPDTKPPADGALIQAYFKNKNNRSHGGPLTADDWTSLTNWAIAHPNTDLAKAVGRHNQRQEKMYNAYNSKSG